MKKKMMKRAKSVSKKVAKRVSRSVKRGAKKVSFKELDFKVGKMNVQITKGGKKSKR